MLEASVIIPTYNRKESLRECLESLNSHVAFVIHKTWD